MGVRVWTHTRTDRGNTLAFLNFTHILFSSSSGDIVSCSPIVNRFILQEETVSHFQWSQIGFRTR